MLKSFNSCAAGRSHCACGTRSRFAFYVLSLLLNKESTKENQLKGLMPLRNPQGFPLSLSFGSYQKAFWHLQSLRWQIKDLPPTASRLSFLATHRAALQSAPREKHLRLLCISRRQLPRAASVKSKSVCPATPSWACAYAPKMAEACESTSPDGSQKAVGMQGVPRGNAWADFLSPFLCSATKKGHPCRYSARAKQCARQKEK